MSGLFVTGTDTGVGKTVVAAAIIAALRSHGVAVRALKPVITGLDETPDPDWPRDHELLARTADSKAADTMLVGYGPPVSPHLAAELAGKPIDPRALVAAARAIIAASQTAIVEGVGGLLVPLTDAYDVRAFARELALPILIAARPGLGTINHTLLTLEAGRDAGLEIAGVVMTPWPENPTEIERSNRETISRVGRVTVSTLAPIERADAALLAAAGRELPLDSWLTAAPRFRPERELA